MKSSLEKQSSNDSSELAYGPINVFRHEKNADAFMQTIKEKGYVIHTIDCSHDFHAQITKAFRFKEQFGYEPWNGNADALHDAIRSDDAEERIAYYFLHFETLLEQDSRTAAYILEDLQELAWNCLLVGKRRIAIIRSSHDLSSCAAKLPYFNRG